MKAVIIIKMINSHHKVPKLLKKEFQLHLEPEKKRSIRVMCTLGLLLYTAFIIVDLFALPSSVSEALAIRGVVIAGFVLAFISTFYKSFIKYYDFIQPAPYVLAAIGIELMIYLSEPTDQASHVYFAGLILVIMVLFSWSHIRVRNLVVSTALIIGGYALIEFRNHNYDLFLSISILLPNLAFLISAAVIGLVTQFIRDSYLRKNFLLQESLKEAYLEKARESETHEHLANHDPLTGLPNRRYVIAKLGRFLGKAKIVNCSLVLLYLDLNGFKQVNDVYGHHAGDEVLRVVAKRLKNCIRKVDCIARLGGDEFIIGLLLKKEDLGIAKQLRENIENSLTNPISFEGDLLQISASIGMSSYPSCGDKVSVLLEVADKKMYLSKNRLKEVGKSTAKKREDEDEEIYYSFAETLI